MAYDLLLSERIRLRLTDLGIQFRELQMMGGLCFMVDDKMCIGVIWQDLMVRIGKESQEELLKIEGARPMDFTGRRMKGFLLVSEENLETNGQLDFWIDKALAYNPLAKRSKK